ncbi:hypothetical protein CIL05_04860 [Virgibacillus profundi]|uniref:YkoP-like domain-containing protein n=1 Tax=Virgibacillus profundi TaxID=2024555 RepID=A0A2A2IIS2_9BACI|nr:hypothetical protein [Virgibacillus profundi]PAV31040.1 hypothetical protein CIL05_04860 [Virgibacillus profundi]PXY55226.1 hypothetical protein CIT14_04945 [Virgibacillus profundi]
MKSYLLGVWNAIDPLYYTFTRLRYVPEQDNCNTLFRVRLTRYKGVKVVLTDGTVIDKNDLLIKIHLHNVRMINELQSINSEIKRAVFVYHMVKRALPRLAAYIKDHQKNNEIKGIIGITTLYKGANRLGLEVFPIKNSYYRIYKKITFLPINLISGKKRMDDPVYLFMSRNELNNKYSAHG